MNVRIITVMMVTFCVLFACHGICQQVSEKGGGATQKTESDQVVTVSGVVKVEGVEAIRDVDYKVWGEGSDMMSNFGVVAPVIKVTEAKGKDGSVIGALKDKTLRILGEKAELIKKTYENRKVTIKGSVKDNSLIYATSVSELK